MRYLKKKMVKPSCSVIFLCHKEDIEQQREKIEDDTEKDGNIDAWLNSARSCSLDEAL